MIRSGNPTLNDKVFNNLVWDPSARMTLQGTVIKSGILLAIVVAAAAIYSVSMTLPLRRST